MQRYIFPATYTIVDVIFLVTFNYFNAFFLGKGDVFAPSLTEHFTKKTDGLEATTTLFLVLFVI